MRFASETWLYVVPALLALWLVLRASDGRARSRLRELLGGRAADHVENDSPRVRTWRRFLLFCGLFFLLLALARPQWGASEVSVTQRGSDIVIALDISNSMLAEDVVPDRMERAKTELGSFLSRLEDSRVGLVFFAGSAFVQCPLTLDYGTADIFLKMAGPDMLSEQGTAIASALEASRELLRKGREGAESGSFQAILLVTDGEDLEGDWEQQAKDCAREGIKVIPVGVGDEGGGLIPVTDIQGRPAGFMKDDQDNVVMTRLDLASLEKLAQLSGGGSTFRIGVDGLAGDRLFSELQRLGRRDLEERRISAFQERYHWPLALALLAFAVRMLVRSRRTDPGQRISSFRGVSLGLLLVLGAGLTAAPARAQLRPPGAAEADRARQNYLAGQFDEALSQYESAVIQAPDDPLISLGVGETLFQLERYDEARREFERTLDLTEDVELRAEALYNAGTTDLAAGEFEKAVQRLRESLELQPGREDALFNLETALRRLQQQQQQQQQHQQDQENQEDQEDEEQQDQQDQQDQQNQDQQDRQDEQQDQQEQQQEQEQQDPQNQEQQEQQQPEQQEQPQPETQDQPQPEELTPEQAAQILQALDRDEEELKRSVQKRLKGGKPRSGKKW